jgi:multiple antibiotic resistance protein
VLTHQPFVLFFALLALYAPVAALPSYLPIVNRLPRGDQLKLALGLFAYVAIFAVVALWAGEGLLELLGISTAALTLTGGVALSYEGVMLMLGKHQTPVEPADRSESRAAGEDAVRWQALLLVPTTFPLTVGGATFALLVSFSAEAGGVAARGLLTIGAVAYAAVTGLTCYAASVVSRKASSRALDLLDRVAGILLTAIAVSLLASGATRLVTDVLHALR